MATRLRLTFTDGTEHTVRLSPRALILAERHFPKGMPPVEGTFYAAWAVIRPAVDFDAWLDTIEEFEESKAEDPQMAASSEASPSLPRPSELDPTNS